MKELVGQVVEIRYRYNRKDETVKVLDLDGLMMKVQEIDSRFVQEQNVSEHFRYTLKSGKPARWVNVLGIEEIFVRPEKWVEVDVSI